MGAIEPYVFSYMRSSKFSMVECPFYNVSSLNLSNNQISSLSPAIGLLVSLRRLDLGFNKLRSLPAEILHLKELRSLDLRFNLLPSLLNEVCLLPRLTKLSVQNNQISSLPTAIGSMKHLTHFFCTRNFLVAFRFVPSPRTLSSLLTLCLGFARTP